MSRSLKAALVLILAAAAASAQQPVRETAPTQSNPPWVVSVVHTINAKKIIPRLHGKNDRVGVLASVPRNVVNVATGLVVDGSGHIVTRLANLDPEDKEQTISITTADGRSLPARLVGIDCATGFAVIEAKSLKVNPPSIAGQTPLANGMQVSVLSTDVRARAVTTSGVEKTYIYPSLTRATGRIKTDSSLAKMRGAMTLLSESLMSRNDSSVVTTVDSQIIGIAEYAGYGRANLYPVSFIRDTVARRVIEKQGTVPAGWLGVIGKNLSEVPEAEIAALGLPPVAGVIVREINPESPAAKSGLALNDVIVGIDETTIAGTEDLKVELISSPAGRSVKLKVIRNRQPVEIAVALGARPVSLEELTVLRIEQRRAQMSERELLSARLGELGIPYRKLRKVAPSKERDEALRELDVEIRQIQDRLTELDLIEQAAASARQSAPKDYTGAGGGFVVTPPTNKPDVIFSFGFTGRDLTGQLPRVFQVSGGVWVTSVTKDSPAALAGIQTGDVIVGIDNREPVTAALLTELSKQGGTISLKVVRRNHSTSAREEILVSLTQQK